MNAIAAGAALIAAAGCASIDSTNLAKAWKIEPLLSVTHSLQPSQAYYTMGRYLDGSQAWDKAIEAYRKAIAADAQNIEAYNALGVALARSGRLADAETTLRQAVALAPSLTHVRSNLGYVLLLAAKPREAVIELKAAVEQDRGNATALANLVDAKAMLAATLKSGEAPVASASPAIASTSHDVASSVPAPALPSPVEPQALALNEGMTATVSVPMPITTADVPAPLPESVSVPGPLHAELASRGVQPLAAARVPVAQPAPALVAESPMTSPPAISLTKSEAASSGRQVSSLPAAPTARARHTLNASRLEISNGNGITGMAARVGRWLATQGVAADRLTNQRPFAQQHTVVQYRNGHEEAALRVARSLPASATTEPRSNLGQRSDVRVVLGRDWVQSGACLEHNTCQPASTRTAALDDPR